MKLFRCFLSLFLATLVLSGCSAEAPESAAPPSEQPEVTVARVQAWQYPVSEELPGIVRPGKRAILSTRIAGTLLAVEVAPGDMVSTGDLLATVDAREVHAAIAAARASINAAESAAEQARLDSQRLQRLYEEDLIARVRAERAEVKHQELEAQLEAARADLITQQANLSYARVTAPFSGRVAETLVDAGSFVGPGQALLVLESRDQWRVDVPVSDRLASSLTSGQQIPIITGSGRVTLPAFLTGVIPALDTGGTGQMLRLSLTSDSESLAPGQVVSVLLPGVDGQGQEQQDCWVGLPAAALIRRGQLTGVMVIEKGGNSPAVVHLRWLETTTPPAHVTDLVPVTRGLAPGEQVVLNPAATLQDGQSVTVERAGADDGKE
ncbi:MAG: efflux RND transporter periplasmic adaptor subunit [Pelovirga sp.]